MVIKKMNTHLAWLFANNGTIKRFMKHQLYHNKKLISGKMNSYEGLHKKCIRPLSLCAFQQSFFAPKMPDFLILNWGKRLDRIQTITIILSKFTTLSQFYYGYSSVRDKSASTWNLMANKIKTDLITEANINVKKMIKTFFISSYKNQ